MVATVALIVLATALIYAVATIGLNLHWGDAGILNFGIAAFIGIGAYTSIILTTPTLPGADRLFGFSYPIVIGLVGAFVVAAIVGGVVGLTTARISGDYIAVVTLAFDRIIRTIAQSEGWLTEGHLGVTNVPSLSSSSTAGMIRSVVIIGVILFAAYYLFRRLSKSAFGRILHAIREDSNVPTALGKDVLRFNVKAFALGAGIMGVSGALLAHYLGFFNPSVFPLAITFFIWTALIIGGSGSYKGAIVGAVLLGIVYQLVRYVPSTIPYSSDLPHLRTMLIGIAMIAVLYYRPYGLFGNKERLSAGGKTL